MLANQLISHGARLQRIAQILFIHIAIITHAEAAIGTTRRCAPKFILELAKELVNLPILTHLTGPMFAHLVVLVTQTV